MWYHGPKMESKCVQTWKVKEILREILEQDALLNNKNV